VFESLCWVLTVLIGIFAGPLLVEMFSHYASK
jgi:hypothetical protein